MNRTFLEIKLGGITDLESSETRCLTNHGFTKKNFKKCGYLIQLLKVVVLLFFVSVFLKYFSRCSTVCNILDFYGCWFAL